MNTDTEKKRVATSVFTEAMEDTSGQSANKRQKVSSSNSHEDSNAADSNPPYSSYHSPPPSGASTESGSLHSAALQRSRRQPKSRQLFGDSPPSKAAAATEADADSRKGRQKPASATKVKKESLVEGGSLSALKKKRSADSLTDAAASFVASSNSGLFSTLTHRKGHQSAASSAMQLSVSGKSSRGSSHRASNPAHDTEDDDAEMEDAEEELEEEEEEEDVEDAEQEVDDEDDEAYDDVDEHDSHASGDIRRGVYYSSQRFPFTFAPLNHQPWMLSWMQHANPIGINSPLSAASFAVSPTSSSAPLSLSHALQNPTFVRSCYARFAYSPLVSWSLKSGSFEEALAEQLGVSVSSLPDRMTKSEWNAARRMMGAPRRLSANFLQRERQRLATAQHKAKEWQMRLVRATHESNVMKLKASIRNKGSLTPLRMRKQVDSHSTLAAASESSLYDPSIDIMLAPDDCPTLLQIGTRVLAPHPRSLELSPGVVLGSRVIMSKVRQDGEGDMSESEDTSVGDETERLVYRIKFLDLPTKVGASLIDSEEVRLIHSSNQSPTLKEQQSAAALLQAELFAPAQSEQGMPAPFLHTEADLSLIAALLKLVDRKKLLIDHLRMANEAMSLLRQHPLAPNFGSGLSASGSILNHPTPLQTVASDASVASVNGEEGGQETDSTLHPAATSGHPGATGSASIASSLSPQLKPHAGIGNIHTIQFTPDQFAAAWQLFQRQYAWVVLQLETTSHNLEAAMTQLRARRTASRRTTASLLTSSSSFHVKALLRGGGVADDSEGGGLDGIEWMQEEAKEILREVIREMMTMRILSKTSMFADEHGTHPIQSLLANCISLMLFIQRCADEGKSMHQMNDVLASIRPKFKEHLPIYESICKSVAAIQNVIMDARSSNRKPVSSL